MASGYSDLTEKIIPILARKDISDLTISGIIADANNDILILEPDGIEVLESRTDPDTAIQRSPVFSMALIRIINAFFKDSFKTSGSLLKKDFEILSTQ
jgi:hypothetical protein